MTIDKIIDDILKREGWPQYTNRSNDKGGPTKGGITLATLSSWRKRECTPMDVKFLELDEAKEIYETSYISKTGYGGIKDGKLMTLMVDCAVLHGALRATRWLQEAVGVKQDGICGIMTLAAVAKADTIKTYDLVCASRIEFIGEIITASYTMRKSGRTAQDQSEFAKGWLKRATSFMRNKYV